MDTRPWFKDAEDRASREREAQAGEGLNIGGFQCKWEKAKELAAKNDRTDDNRLLPYWERVRLIFLELGGGYVDQYERRQ